MKIYQVMGQLDDGPEINEVFSSLEKAIAFKNKWCKYVIPHCTEKDFIVREANPDNPIAEETEIKCVSAEYFGFEGHSFSILERELL